MASTIVVDKIQKPGGVAFVLPVADGNAGQSLQTDGSLALSWGDVDPIVAKGGDIASASPTVIPDGNLYYDVTGTTGFSAFTVTAGRHFILQFDGALVMTHHADNLDLPGEASITTVAGDVAEFVSTATDKAQCVNYTRADGTAVAGSTNATTVAAAGALMDSELAGIAAVKATTGTFLTADQTKLDAIEASADVTDATNVTAAGALMDSEVTNLAEVKAFADSDYATAAQGTLATNALPKGGGTMTGNIVGGDTTMSAVNLKDYGETTNAIGGTGGGTQDIDLVSGNSITATVDTSTNTFTFSNPTASDEGCGFTLVLTNGGSQTVNWPASVDWAGGEAPELTTSGVDILTFWTVDGGKIWHGMAASLDSKTPS